MCSLPQSIAGNCVERAGGWKNHMSASANRTGCGGYTTCPGCMELEGSVGDLSRRSGGTLGPLDWHTSMMEPPRNVAAAVANADSEDSPIMLSSSTSLERDVRELKRYVRMFVNRQKEGARKNAIAMEWRTMALVLDRLFFFVYIATIGITVVTSLPRSKRLDGSN